MYVLLSCIVKARVYETTRSHSAFWSVEEMMRFQNSIEKFYVKYWRQFGEIIVSVKQLLAYIVSQVHLINEVALKLLRQLDISRAPWTVCVAEEDVDPKFAKIVKKFTEIDCYTPRFVKQSAP